MTKKELINKYPDLFKHAHIGCGNGWLKIIETAASALDKVRKEKKLDLSFTQIKEKFGTLRLYVNIVDVEVNQIIAGAETASINICEDCGAPGSQISKGGYWLRTLCSKCDTQQC